LPERLALPSPSRSIVTRQSRTIVLLTGSSLCHNPRALKEATALSRAGHQVEVLGAWFDPALKARDLQLLAGLPFAFTPVIDATRTGPRATTLHFARRAARKAAQLAHDALGWENARQLGVRVAPLLHAAKRRSADLYLAHSEPGLYAAHALLRDGCRVGVDMEDWFSEDLLPEARRHRPLRLLRSLEGELLRRGACSFCTSEAMAAALAATYACRRPTVIYNAFPWSERDGLNGAASDRVDCSLPSLYWVSQTMGPERGIEDLLAALPFMSGACEIHLRGVSTPGFADWIATRLPETWRRRVFLHGLVDNAALLPRVAEHDIGFAGELTYCRNKVLTVSNKILYYLLGGLAVLASDTEGQQEVARQAPGAVQLYRAGDPQDLARQLDALLASPTRRKGMRLAALEVTREMFCWERQEDKLLTAVASAFGATADMPEFAGAGAPAS
jgi:glycosyltransferase involved in cell wall biosynthesis